MSETPRETPQWVLNQWLTLSDRYPHPAPSHIREAIRAVLALLVESEAMLVEEHDARMQACQDYEDACQDYEDENARFESRGGMIDRLEAERDALRAEVERSHKAILALTGEVERLWAAGEGHPGFCCGACSGRYADEKARAERAEAALREISVADGANHAGVLALAALRDTAPAEEEKPRSTCRHGVQWPDICRFNCVVSRPEEQP